MATILTANEAVRRAFLAVDSQDVLDDMCAIVQDMRYARTGALDEPAKIRAVIAALERARDGLEALVRRYECEMEVIDAEPRECGRDQAAP